MVRYGRAATRIGMAYRRYRTRYNVARRVVRGGMMAANAATKIQRAFRKSSLRKAIRGWGAGRRVRSARQQANGQEVINAPSGTPTNIGQLNIRLLELAKFGTTEPNRRRSNRIHISGIKYCWQFHNMLRPLSTPPLPGMSLDVHFAAVQLRGSSNSGNWTSAEALAHISPFFFREFSQVTADNDTRSRAFNNYVTGSEYDFGKSCLSLATERMTVLFHKKFPLFARYGTSDDGIGLSEQGHWYRKVEGYMKLNKTFSFASNTDTVGTYPIVWIWWCNPLTSDNMPTVAQAFPNIDRLNQNSRTVVYWKSIT